MQKTKKIKALKITLKYLTDETLDEVNHAWSNLNCPLCQQYAKRTNNCNDCPLTQFKDLKYDDRGCTDLSVLLFGNLEYDPSILASIVMGLIIGYEKGEL